MQPAEDRTTVRHRLANRGQQIQKSMTALEDVKGLYSMLEQAATIPRQTQQLNMMMQDIERHYLYLNSILASAMQ